MNMPSTSTRTRPRILHVVTHLDLGGAESVALELIERLHERFDFSVFAVQGVADTPVGRAMAARLERLGIPVASGTHLDMKRGGMLHGGLSLARHLARTRPDVVHLHTEIPESAFAVATLLRPLPNGTRVLRTIHNAVLWPVWNRIGRWVEQRLDRVGADVVAVSEAALRGLEAFRGEPVRSKAWVVYNGVPQPRRLSGASDRRADAPVRVLFAGRLELQKGADLFPEIIDRAAQRAFGTAHVSIVGSGTLDPALRAWAARRTSPWTVEVAPPRPDLAAWLAEFDVLVHPSRFEGLGLACIEAMLVGVPVIATRVTGLSEVFPPDYPLLADSEDVDTLASLLARTVDDPRGTAETTSPYRDAIARRFDPGVMARHYADVYGAPVPALTGPLEIA